ncbi:hypothetical protein K7432_017818, partial [Basidiobolus ranarum]
GISPADSEVTQDFEKDFQAKSIPYESIAFPYYGSVIGLFAAAGIPSCGSISGALRIKTEVQVKIFGGTAGKSLDECFHFICDTTKNLNA